MRPGHPHWTNLQGRMSSELSRDKISGQAESSFSPLTKHSPTVCFNMDANSSDFPLDPDVLELRFDDIIAQVPKTTPDETNKAKSLYEALRSDTRAAAFFEAIESNPRLAALLQDETSEYTVFLPLHFESNYSTADELEQALSLHISPHYVTLDGMLHMPNVPMLLTPSTSNGPVVVRARPSESGWTVDGVTVSQGDCLAGNGVIHKLDPALSLPLGTAATLQALKLTRLHHAVTASGFIATIEASETKGGTFFAPSEKAWLDLGENILRFLDTEHGYPYLLALLKKHFCPNITFFSNLIWPQNNTGDRQTSADGQRRIKGKIQRPLQTALGDGVTVTIDIARFNGLIVMRADGDAKFLQQDVPTTNGATHVIDKVLLPTPMETPKDLEMFKELLAPYVRRAG